MMKKYIILFVAIGINAFGTWLTFLAIALLTKDQFGSGVIAYNFLIQSLPSILLSPIISKVINSKNSYKIYLITQLTLSCLVISLIFIQIPFYLYVYLIASACLNAFAAPALLQIIKLAISEHDLQEFMIRYSSINGAMLFISPAVGGFLSQKFGYNLLFFLDAISFILAFFLIYAYSHLINLKSLLHGQSELSTQNYQPINTNVYKNIFLIKERQLPSLLNEQLFRWYFLLFIGAVLNAFEFPIFEKNGFNSSHIGLIIGSWGLGQTISLLFGELQIIKKLNLNKAIILLMALLLFYISKDLTFSALAFSVGGYFTALLTGEVRGATLTNIPKDSSVAEISTLMQSRTGMINLVTYGLISKLFLDLNLIFIPILFLIACTPLILNLKLKI